MWFPIFFLGFPQCAFKTPFFGISSNIPKGIFPKYPRLLFPNPSLGGLIPFNLPSPGKFYML